MIRSLTPSSMIFQVNDLHCSRVALYVSCSSRSHDFIPKLEPFSRSKIDRCIKEPSLIQKSENELAGLFVIYCFSRLLAIEVARDLIGLYYCSTLEGDPSYSCWRAYFELKDLERELSKEDVENLVLQSGGVKSLIDCLHGISAIHKQKKEEIESPKPLKAEKRRDEHLPVPDGLPRSQEEMEEEEKARMPDSPFTRMLRTKGRFPAWYSPVPDHETD
ncbi:hypothetical protein HHK36_003122 [Tetracentron sinense]|uniref:Uncharacterized protein n=1 Tax=Tetracentron sinense TaxID=13715 RepID=A0A834ZSC4_TETSI|nr:hypothetical protein HHK36_003122 [Tetracentron sinense]